MSLANTINGDLLVLGNINATGTPQPLSRTQLTQEDNARYKLDPTHWRVWDAIDAKLPADGQVESAVEAASFAWDPNVADSSFWVAGRAYRCVGITSRVEVAGTDGGAVTAVVKKAASGTDIASGTALHTGSINLKGTVDANQALTLSATSSDLDIAAGTCIGFDLTGTPTAARGCLSVLLAPAPSPDDLRIVGGTFGSASPSIQTGDVKAQGTTTKRARFQFTLPTEYVAGQSITIRSHAGMLTTVSDGVATIDFEAYRSNDEAGISADLVTTAATTIKSLTLANQDFVVTPTNCLPGDTIDIRMTVSITDAATATAVIGIVGSVEVLLDVKG